MKKIFVIDWISFPLFMFCTYTGIELHLAGHDGDHAIWHAWALTHVVSSLLFLIAGICHISTHWGWYKGLVKNGIGRKSKISCLLSAAFVSAVATGIILLGVDGADSSLGLWHYRIGILVSALSAGHILRRIPVLRKSLK